MKRTTFRSSLACLMLCGAATAFADGSRMPPDPDKTWLEECGTCHVAYPPALLTADTWRRLMAGLDRHFGSNAALDAPTAARITTFLERNASTRGERNAAASLRITDTRWFTRKHDELSPTVWHDPKVKSPANCAACHRNAESGRYDEHDIALPNVRR